MSVFKRRERYYERERNLIYREEDQDIEEGTVGVCERSRGPVEIRRMRLKILRDH